jgi:hypothetical protein
MNMLPLAPRTPYLSTLALTPHPGSQRRIYHIKSTQEHENPARVVHYHQPSESTVKDKWPTDAAGLDTTPRK